MPRDAWVALAVAAASAVALWELARTPGTGAFVTTTTFPTVVCAALLALALLLFFEKYMVVLLPSARLFQ